MATSTTTPSRQLRMDWLNTTFLVAAHGLALWGVVHLITNFHWQTLLMGFLWFAFCGVSITGGYHRLFSHPTYKASGLLEWFYLCFGAASVQNSALKWSADHRIHHGHTDTDRDPYDINRGFWWAHIGWVMFKKEEQNELDLSRVPDLARNERVMFQHKYYVPLAIVFGAVIPGLLGLLWGDVLGAILVCGFLRLVAQYHATFSINSFAHLLGTQPYSSKDSARDSWITALLAMGEGYHNFHHSFPADYRNGVRWWQFDPTKWWVWSLSHIGVTKDLKRVSWDRIQKAREAQAERSKSAA